MKLIRNLVFPPNIQESRVLEFEARDLGPGQLDKIVDHMISEGEEPPFDELPGDRPLGKNNQH